MPRQGAIAGGPVLQDGPVPNTIVPQRHRWSSRYQRWIPWPPVPVQDRHDPDPDLADDDLGICFA
jgi:hypothetical protein